MSVTYNTAAANARLAAGLTAAVSGQSVDGGAGFGVLVIGTAALSGATGVLATITLQKPCVSISAKVATLLGVPLSVTASATGTAAKAELRDSAGNVIVSGLTVGTSATDIVVGSTAFSSGISVQINSPSTITHP